MKTANIFALASLFASFATAAPLPNKRDVEWVTVYTEAVETVVVYTTVWVPPTKSRGGHGHRTRVSAITTTQEAVPTTTSTSVAPPPETTSTTSEYVAWSESTTSTSTSTTSTTQTPEETTTYVPPAPSTTEIATTTHQAETSTYQAESSTQQVATQPTGATEASTSGSGTSFTGDLTWYDVGLGACGEVSTKDQPIVAISEDMFDQHQTGANPNTNPLCGKKIKLTYGGSTYDCTVVDRCTGCAYGDLDLSYDFFNTVTHNGDGRVYGATWHFA